MSARINTVEEEEESWRSLNYNTVLSAVDNGNISAKTQLAWLKLSGIGGAVVDEDGAVKLLEERAKNRDIDAMWMLGMCCEYGIGTEQDVKKAEELYKQSSKGGNKIGTFFEERLYGRGSYKMWITRNTINVVEKMLAITPITVLDLSRSGSPAGSEIKISELLKTNTSLTELDLSCNSIGVEGARKISESLMVNTTLTQLSLRGAKRYEGTNDYYYSEYFRNIEEEGLLFICESLKHNTSLTKLDLGYNNIKKYGAREISGFLKVNSTLTALDLDGNYFGEEGASLIGEALRTNTTLTSLCLKGWWDEHYNTGYPDGHSVLKHECCENVGEKGAIAMCVSLRSNSTLTSLDLGSNGIGEEGERMINQLLQTNSTLTYLKYDNMRYNCMEL